MQTILEYSSLEGISRYWSRVTLWILSNDNFSKMEKPPTSSWVFQVVLGGWNRCFCWQIFHGLSHLCVKSKTPSKKNTNTTASYDELKGKRAWDVALAPVKSLPVQAFMLYMSGGGVQIFSIGIVFMLLLSPIKNIAGMNEGVFFQFSLRILH